jgi:farnesyl-diphosphate farnesyltransferase
MAIPTTQDFSYQERSLQEVSRTFALTIPELPPKLREVVSNGYLLCRIADTIEDDPGLTSAQQLHFSQQFTQVVEGTAPAEDFANQLHPLLSPELSEAERDLVLNTPRVIRITHSFNANQRRALARCVRIMAQGMAHYQAQETSDGLADQPAMDRYCYYVAGVVGEMLTELFCDYSEEINRNKAELMGLAVSFGQGLQMTNILKDIWEDRERGACWLPRDAFRQRGLELKDLTSGGSSHPGFSDGLGQLIGVANMHLHNALRYTLLIPEHERGIRRFCLWALGMAVLTLRKIDQHRNFTSGREVKISRRSVKATVFITSALAGCDRLLKFLLFLSSRDLPMAPDYAKLTTSTS